MNTTNHFDFLVVGGGILGLSIADKLLVAHPTSKIAVLEKEPGLGYHGSGRNSGVLHSGIYYPEKSLKARLCARGAAMLRNFCEEEKLAIDKIGKVILPTSAEDDSTLTLLMTRAKANGVEASLVNEAELKTIEPLCRSASGRAIHVPQCAVVNPIEVLTRLSEKLRERGVRINLIERL